MISFNQLPFIVIVFSMLYAYCSLQCDVQYQHCGHWEWQYLQLMSHTFFFVAPYNAAQCMLLCWSWMVYSPSAQLVVGYPPILRMVLFNPWISLKAQGRVLRYSSVVICSISRLGTCYQCVHPMGCGILTLPHLCAYVSASIIATLTLYMNICATGSASDMSCIVRRKYKMQGRIQDFVQGGSRILRAR